MSSTFMAYKKGEPLESIKKTREEAGRKHIELMNVVGAEYKDEKEKIAKQVRVWIEMEDQIFSYTVDAQLLHLLSGKKSLDIAIYQMKHGEWTHWKDKRQFWEKYQRWRRRRLKEEYMWNPSPELKERIKEKRKAIKDLEEKHRRVFYPTKKKPKRIMYKKGYFSTCVSDLIYGLMSDLENNTHETLSMVVRDLAIWTYEHLDFLDDIGALLPAVDIKSETIGFRYTGEFPGMKITVEIISGSPREYTLPKYITELGKEEAKLYQSQGQHVTYEGIIRLGTVLASIVQVDKKGQAAITAFYFILLPKDKAASVILFQLDEQNWLITQLRRLVPI